MWREEANIFIRRTIQDLQVENERLKKVLSDQYLIINAVAVKRINYITVVYQQKT